MTKKTNDEQPKKKKLNKSDVKIKELELKAKELENDYLRSRAEFENFRKRKEKELEEARDRAIISFVEDLLPAIDNFEMSLKMTDNKEMFIKGVEMIHKNLLDTLKQHHFEEFFPIIGEDFNPHLHDPQLIENREHEPGRILGVVKKGFKRKDKVVRPARVQVSANPNEEDSFTTTDSKSNNSQ